MIDLTTSSIPNIDTKNKMKTHKYIMARSSFFVFYKLLGYEVADFHREWFDFFMNNKDTVIIAPRNHGKSVFTIVLIIWIMLFPEKWRKYFDLDHQLLKITYCTSTSPTARKWYDDFMVELENAMLALDLEGDVTIQKGNTEEVTLSNLSKLQMITIMGSVRGVRSHLLFNDDLMKDKGMRIEDVIYNYEYAIYPTRYPNTHAMLVGTVKTEDDIMMKSLNNDAYAGKLYKSINYTPKGEEFALWETVRPLEWLRQVKTTISPVTFAREYQNEPVSDEFAVMPRGLLMQGNRSHLSFHDRPKGAVYFGVDLARSDRKDADYSVIVVVEIASNFEERELPVFILREIWTFHASEIKEKFNKKTGKTEKEPFYKPIIRKLAEWNRKYQPSKIYVENNGFQEVITQMGRDPDLVGKEVLPTVGATTTRKKHHAQEGIPMLRSMLQSTRLIFPYGDDYTISKIDSLHDELQKWIENPQDRKYYCTAEHDDRSMALYTVLRETSGILDRFLGVDSISKGSARIISYDEEEEEVKEKANQKGRIYIGNHFDTINDWRNRVA